MFFFCEYINVEKEKLPEVRIGWTDIACYYESYEY